MTEQLSSNLYFVYNFKGVGEGCIHKTVDYLDCHNILFQYQFGFRLGRLITHAVSEFIRIVLFNLSENLHWVFL